MYGKLTRNNIRAEIWLLVWNIQWCKFCRPPKNYTNPRRILLGFRFHADEAGSGKIFHPRQRKMPCKDGAKNNNPRNRLLCEEFRHNKFRVWLLHCDCPHRDACFYSNYLIIIVDSMVWKKSNFTAEFERSRWILSIASLESIEWRLCSYFIWCAN